MPDPNSPLNDNHLQQLNNALSAAKVAEVQIEMARRAGINQIPGSTIDELDNLNKDNVTKLRNIKQVYFPGQ